MSAKPRDLGMTPLDDLFSTDESRAEAQLEKVVTLNPTDISDFPNHPFKVKQDEAMAEMVDSVKQYGVLVPALVRPKADGGYEMVAGHRRKCAATLAVITEMPCIVRNLTDDEATIIMVDSNLQRETILPSEKAFAYKMKLEAMKRQGQRSDLTSRPVDTKSRSDEQLAKDSPDSARQIQRYIRLTKLIPSVLDMVDSGKIEGFSFRVTGPNGYVGVFTTDKNGEIIIDDLRIGEYVVSEVSDGASSAYVLPADKTASMFEGAVTKVEMHNELRDTPKTGEDSNPDLWLALLGVSAAGAATLGVVGFRKRRKEDAE